MFVHLSAVRDACLADLRKGQKISFEIFDNQGKAAAKNLLCTKTKLWKTSRPEIVQCNMNQKKTEEPIKKRTWITHAALESALAENVRGSDPQCKGLIEIIVERVVPASPDGANWAVKGVKYGKAEREACNAAISKVVEEGQREFEVSDWS